MSPVEFKSFLTLPFSKYGICTQSAMRLFEGCVANGSDTVVD